MEGYTIEPVKETEQHQITPLWETSVRATHTFLDQDDITFYRNLIQNDYLRMVTLYCIKIENTIVGFLGITGNSVEMLFVHPSHFRKGVGKTLLEFAIHKLGCIHVDVNEQNKEALSFYNRVGFTVFGRSETDGQGKPYPVVHMLLQ